jgi:hypothetical protein
MKRRIFAVLPFALSLALSISTVGPYCAWQDSGFYLVAVKELGILYPPGFALYVVLCKAWTLLLGFVDFTVAVHLFSAFCAAGAAATLAVATRDLLRTKGPIFRTIQEEGPWAEGIGASIGCLAASGFTFWASAILAKVYAFYFLILTLLIWRMIRADEDRRPRDFTIVAVLIGLAWQAHPSATTTGLALLLFVLFHRGAVGGKGIAWRVALAALCALGPLLLLLLFRFGGGSALAFGDPGSWRGFWEYAFGTRFTGNSEHFGLEGSRVASVGRYFWEEFLGIAALFVGAGLVRLWTLNRRLLIGLAAWVVPVLGITLLFKLEGQHDFWMVAAWIPLWMAAAVGLSIVPKRQVAAAAVAIGTLWAVLANYRDLDQRHYALAETFGHSLLDDLGPQAGLFVESDDAASIILYLQRVRGLRPDVRLVTLGATRNTGLPAGPGDYADTADWWTRGGTPESELEGWGPLVKRKGGALKPWRPPIAAEQMPPLFRRFRGQIVDRSTPPRITVRPEPYERRLLRVLLLARKFQADELSRRGGFGEAAGLYESILALDPDSREDPTIILPLAVADVGLQRYPQAEALFRQSLTLKLTPAKLAASYYFLAALCGNRPEAAEWRAKALASPDLPSELRAKLEGR